MDPRLVQCVALVLKLDPGEVTSETAQDNTPGWDSLSHLRLILELEQNFGLRFRSQDIPTMTSLSHIQTVLAKMSG